MAIDTLDHRVVRTSAAICSTILSEYSGFVTRKNDSSVLKIGEFLNLFKSKIDISMVSYYISNIYISFKCMDLDQLEQPHYFLW